MTTDRRAARSARPVSDHDEGTAQKIQTTLIADLDPDVEATGTVTLALDGATYEIDLSDEHTAELRATIAPYAAAAGRKVGGPQAIRGSRRPAAARAAISTNDGPNPSAVRTWARKHDIAINDRGRIKGTVLAQFLEATGTQLSRAYGRPCLRAGDEQGEARAAAGCVSC